MTSSKVLPLDNPHVAAIVGTATQQFAAQGYHGTSMRDIGSKLGIYAGSLYVHIQSKEDILYAIVWPACQRALQELEDATSSDLDPRGALERIAQGYLRRTLQQPDVEQVFLHETRHLSGARLNQVLSAGAQWEAGVQQVVQKGIDTGLFRAVDATLATQAFINVLTGSRPWAAVAAPLDADITGALLVQYLVEGWSFAAETPASAESHANCAAS